MTRQMTVRVDLRIVLDPDALNAEYDDQMTADEIREFIRRAVQSAAYQGGVVVPDGIIDRVEIVSHEKRGTK